MNILLLISGIAAIIASIGVIVMRRIIHSLLYLIASFFALAICMVSLGSAFAAILEIVVYAGAILILIVFVVMMLGIDKEAKKGGMGYLGPIILSVILLGEILYALSVHPVLSRSSASVITDINPTLVGTALFSTYALCVEIVAFVLLAGLVGAYKIGNINKESAIATAEITVVEDKGQV